VASASWLNGWLSGDVVTVGEFRKGVGCVFDTILSVASASIDTGAVLPTTYAHMLIVMYARSDAAVTSDDLLIRFNGDTAANYDRQFQNASATTVSTNESFAQTAGFGGAVIGASGGANLFAASQVLIPHYANAANNKAALVSTIGKWGTSTGNMVVGQRATFWRSNAAINRVILLPGTGNFVAGTRATIYVMGA
jgi:hypothetical protein